MVLFVRNDNATKLNPRAPVRTPSLFTASTAREMAVLGVTRGWVDENHPPDGSQRFQDAVRTRGLNGDGVDNGGQRTFGNLCIPITRWGQ